MIENALRQLGSGSQQSLFLTMDHTHRESILGTIFCTKSSELPTVDVYNRSVAAGWIQCKLERDGDIRLRRYVQSERGSIGHNARF